MDYKDYLTGQLYHLLEGQLTKTKIRAIIEKPKHDKLGDFAFPCFELAKIYRKSPQLIAADLESKLRAPLFEKVQAVGGYVNVYLDKSQVSSSVVNEILSLKEKYGSLEFGDGNVITIDFSSPNIAKPFSMGHLRSTVIGNALALLSEKCGYRVVRLNHLGDWGTQFGKLIIAYKMWGNENEVKENPIQELLKLYVKFHEEAEIEPSLNDQGRSWFKKLEEGNSEALQLWEWFRKESLKEFIQIYNLLGITFDSFNGEAFYNDKMNHVLELLEKKSLLEESEGAYVVPLHEKELPPCLIKKRDGTTLYATRDLAAALYREDTYKFQKCIYVVGNEQALHFKQLFAVLEKMGLNWQNGMVHVPFGMMLKDGKKMSTRKGKVVLLEEVLTEAISLAAQNIDERNPNLVKKDVVARQVGVGAVIFHDLKNFRLNDIDFSLEDMLKFEGETGPYVQYTHARCCSLLRKGDYQERTESIFLDDEAWPIVTVLLSFPDVIERAFEHYDPSKIAKYLLELSKALNKYYSTVRILDDAIYKNSRLSLVYAVTIVLNEGLRLLGLESPVEM